MTMLNDVWAYMRGEHDPNNPILAPLVALEGVPIVQPLVDPAVALIIDFEESGKFAAKPYLDPAGVPTQGYGSIWVWSTTKEFERLGRVTMQSPEIDEATAREWLGDELHDVIKTITADVKVPLTAGMMEALEDFIYNLGSGNFATSTLLRKLNQGDYHGAANEFDRWTHAGGVELAGLVRRRAVEKSLFEQV